MTKYQRYIFNFTYSSLKNYAQKHLRRGTYQDIGPYPFLGGGENPTYQDKLPYIEG